MSTNYTYDYYTVYVPSDFSEDPQERANGAFIMAEEMTKLYVMPCVWYVVSDDGEYVKVCRKRHKQTK